MRRDFYEGNLSAKPSQVAGMVYSQGYRGLVPGDFGCERGGSRGFHFNYGKPADFAAEVAVVDQRDEVGWEWPRAVDCNSEGARAGCFRCVAGYRVRK